MTPPPGDPQSTPAAGRGRAGFPVPFGAGEPARLRRLAAAAAGLLIGLILAAAGPPVPGYAHGELLSTTPANGTRLDTAPAEIALRFSERVNLVRDGIQLLGAGGPVPTPGPARIDPAAPARVVLPLPAGLGPGRYTVSWRVVSADSHPIHGAFAFGVGDVALGDVPDATARTDTDPTVSVTFWAFRWLGYAALALLAGGAWFLYLCWPAGWRRPGARRLLLGGWAGGLTCAVAVLLVQGPYASGATFARITDPGLLAGTLGTDYGRSVLARICLLLAGGAVLYGAVRLSGRPRRRAAPAAAAVLGLGLPITWVGTGHANAGADLLAAGADAAHLAAMAAWLGGLGFLAACLLRPSAPEPVTEVGTALIRFSRLATACVCVLVATGVYQAWRGVGTLAALTSSDYGTLLVYKLAAVGVLLWLGAMSRSVVRRRYLLPALRAAADPAAGGPGRAAPRSGGPGRAAPRSGGPGRARPRSGGPGRSDRAGELLARRYLRWSVRGEAGIAAAVLGLTALLVATPPGARHGTEPPPAPAAPVAIATELPLAIGGRVAIRFEPATTGASTLRIVVYDASGRPAAVPEVKASLDLPEQDLGPIPVTLARTGPGEYRSQGLSLPMPGGWRLRVTVRTTEIDQATVEARIAVT